ncbi:nitrilase [Sulfodiicoccus acidiphilus]|uniref:Nitrilase n=2 Tax=Sulfodiicoccus acidiphilus TaxID=1670455 RepID=A0A348B1A4_9CREN|nr:nitrilase [Sulfodiicoccus acidiphilus]GGT91744.1 nitrilase [Sulfodiicoccus acidiphilus]
MVRKHNLEKARKLLKISKEKGAKLVVLPSMFPVGSTLDPQGVNDRRTRNMVKNLAERIPGSLTDSLVDLAMEGQIHLIAGPILEQAGPKIFLTMLFISPQGEIIGKYRKIYPSERDVTLGISPGREPINMVLDKKYGIIAEDDLFSPEINRILTLGGSQLMIVTTRNGPVTRSEIVKHVAITRSIENGVPYLVVGGVIEDDQGDVVAFSPTFVSTPDAQVYKEIAGYEDGVITVESTMLTQSRESKSGYPSVENTVSILCKSFKKMNSTTYHGR